MAGLGPRCSRVEAFLFQLKTSVHFKFNTELSCTSKRCAGKGTKHHVDPAAIENINVKQHALLACSTSSFIQCLLLSASDTHTKVHMEYQRAVQTS